MGSLVISTLSSHVDNLSWQAASHMMAHIPSSSCGSCRGSDVSLSSTLKYQFVMNTQLVG
eukprot:6249713-Amphidinium_carterae.1